MYVERKYKELSQMVDVITVTWIKVSGNFYFHNVILGKYGEIINIYTHNCGRWDIN